MLCWKTQTPRRSGYGIESVAGHHEKLAAFDPEKLKEGLALLIAKEMESKLAES